MTTALLDPVVLRDRLRAAGVECGELSVAGPSGKRHVWTDHKIVVRVTPRNSVLRNAGQLELEWASRIGNVVPIQRALATTIELGEAFATVWEWLAGGACRPEHAAAHGQLLRTLHDNGGFPDGGEAVFDQLTNTWAKLPLIADGTLRSVLTGFAERAAEILNAADSGHLVLSHGDAHDRNLLVVDGVLHLIDFDSAGWADRHVDFASGVYAWRHNHGSESSVKAFLEGYGPHPDLPLDMIDALVWVRRMRATCTRAALGQNVDERVAELALTEP